MPEPGAPPSRTDLLRACVRRKRSTVPLAAARGQAALVSAVTPRVQPLLEAADPTRPRNKKRQGERWR